MSDDIDLALAHELLDAQNEIMAKIKAEQDHAIIRELLDALCEIMKDYLILHTKIFKEIFNE